MMLRSKTRPPPTPIKHIQSKDLLYTPFMYNLPEFVSPKYFFFHAFLAVLRPCQDLKHIHVFARPRNTFDEHTG